MKNDFGGLLVGGGEPTYVKLKEVEKLAVRHFNSIPFGKDDKLSYEETYQFIIHECMQSIIA